jgi:rhodanese-related sulfurtransferase
MRRKAAERIGSVSRIALLAVLLVTGCRSTREGAPENGGEGSPAFSRVRPPVAFEMLRDNPGLAVLDLRPRPEYAGPVGHIRGALNVPLEEISQSLATLAPLKNRTFLVYCGHDDCGPRGLAMLVEEGFDEAILMDGGIDAWVSDGFGTVTGEAPSLEIPKEQSEEIVVD